MCIRDSYENQSFSALLNTFAGEASIIVGDVDSGPDYAFFAIDDRLSLWEWIARLARHADVPAWTDAQGRLNARAPRGQPAARFRWGETLLDLEATVPANTATGSPPSLRLIVIGSPVASDGKSERGRKRSRADDNKGAATNCN